MKMVLGWLIDVITRTIKLPAHCWDWLAKILVEFPCARRQVGLWAWQKLLGELQSMLLGIPGSTGCFSLLQATLFKAMGGCIRLSTTVHDQLDDIWWLATSLGSQPMHITELINDEASFVLG